MCMESSEILKDFLLSIWSKGWFKIELFSLIKIYVELNGDTSQAENVPDEVRLKLRPEGRSYFRDGTGKVRVFHQALADTSLKYNWRYLTYDRFKMTDEAKCREASKNPATPAPPPPPKKKKKKKKRITGDISYWESEGRGGGDGGGG